ncbi:uncharacterized protein LOC101736924 isoform X2 [Bombyx mori]|uniref:Uncharacterized protein n=1 Tax=Bombyx mori TaxID=7091 RepID=A0A8R2AJT1_BOMMO|nr:uncharacterized protein LOC101736924 [Bombyx mori]
MYTQRCTYSKMFLIFLILLKEIVVTQQTETAVDEGDVAVVAEDVAKDSVKDEVIKKASVPKTVPFSGRAHAKGSVRIVTHFGPNYGRKPWPFFMRTGPLPRYINSSYIWPLRVIEIQPQPCYRPFRMQRFGPKFAPFFDFVPRRTMWQRSVAIPMLNVPRYQCVPRLQNLKGDDTTDD